MPILFKFIVIINLFNNIFIDVIKLINLLFLPFLLHYHIFKKYWIDLGVKYNILNCGIQEKRSS